MKTIPLDPALAERLAAAQLATPFCGFCRTERAAVDELKAAMELSPTGRLPSQPALPGEQIPRPGQKLVEADFSELETRVLAHMERESLITPWYHPLANIAEWRKGCSCAVSAPGECLECTNALINAIEGWLIGNLPHQPGDTMPISRKLLKDVLERAGKALGKDHLIKLVSVPEAVQAQADQLEQAQATIKEMGGLIDDLNQQMADSHSADAVIVDKTALKELLVALDGPGHLIRELQATRHLPGHTNSIDLLSEQLRASR